MRSELFPFQKKAVWDLRKKAAQALRAYRDWKTPQIVSLQAPTGSGKTLMAAAFLEDVLCGTAEPPPGEAAFEAQPDAVVVWLSDSPELNRQSQEKIECEADRIGAGRTVEIEEAGFDRETLEDGCIYFLNTQKLASPGRLGRRGESRHWTIWQTLANTAREKSDRFYFVIDEAHRGASGGDAGRATTIMQRFLKGWRGQDGTEMPPMPLVIGMSATAERFNRLAEGVASTVAKTLVGADEVRASGLLKDRILIGYPESSERAGDMAILSAATDEWVRKRTHWEEYCRVQRCAPVDPVLVVQVEAGVSGGAVSATDLAAVVAKIGERIGRPLREGEIVHTFGGARPLEVEGLRVRAVDPSRIAEDHGIGVVLFKENLSTGWDCPRAETMVSFRTARDSTYIAQLLGRMVRTPLQRRIRADESLNEVRLFLPRFDAATVEGVIEALRSNECGEIPADAEAEVIGGAGWSSGAWTTRPGGRRTMQDVPGQTFLGGVEVEAGEGGDAGWPHPQQTPDVLPPMGRPVGIRPAAGRGRTVVEQPPLSLEIDREGIVRAVNRMGLLTYEVRTRQTSDHLRALFSLSGLLARTGIARDAREDAEEAAVTAIHDFAEGLRRSGRYENMAKQVLEMTIAVRVFDALGNQVAANRQLAWTFASDEDLDRQLRAGDGVLGGAGIASRYGRKFENTDDPTEWKTDVILFAADEGRVAELREWARTRFRELDDANRRYATSRGEKLRAQYDEIVASADAVSLHAFRLGNEVAAGGDREGEHFWDHLYVGEEGFATIALNGMEAGLIREESRRRDFASWLRNRPRAQWALCIPYEKDGRKTAMYPDFLVFRRDDGMEDGYVVDVLEPHGAHFADNLAKAKGLAHYAEVERKCGRIQLIREDQDSAGRKRYVRLDMTRGETREKVLRAASNEELANLFRSDGVVEES